MTMTTLPPPGTMRQAWRNDPASESQRRLIENMRTERMNTLGPCPPGMTKGEASDAIEYLKGRPYATQAPATPMPTIDDGLYVYQDKIVRIRHAIYTSGAQYAQTIVPATGRWATQRTLITRIRLTPRLLRPLTRDEAAAYGKVYGRCIVCGRVLTDDESIAQGIGPVCITKEGWA